MKVTGSYEMKAQRPEVGSGLLDTGSLARCIPGCKKLEEIGPNEYKAHLEVGIASIKGNFEGQVRMLDLEAPTQLKMVVEGHGKRGHLKGIGELRLVENPEGTEISYDGEVEVGGPVAGVGQRMLSIDTRRLIQQFFNNLNETLNQPVDPAPPSVEGTG